jgi:carboxymethylenebutenolidase
MQTTLLSNGRTLRLESFLPKTPGPHPAILILHGSGGNTGFWLERIVPFVGRFQVAVFAVHYLDATGDLRAAPAQLTDGIHVPLWLQAARDALSHIAAHPAIDPARIALLGNSLGAYMALALATEGKTSSTLLIRCLVDISGGLIPPWDALATSAFPPTLILHGDADTVVPIANARTLDALLTRLNVPHELRILRGEGHWFTPAADLKLFASIAPFLIKYL